jgi:hypothetical protein
MLLSYAATQNHNNFRPLALEFLKSTEVTECLLFGLVANCTSVDENKIRLAIIHYGLELFLTKDFH